MCLAFPFIYFKFVINLNFLKQVGIILFLMGMIAIMKEHIPLVLTFSVAMIIYLLVFMYSRVITSPGLIILRTFILLLLSIEAFCFCIMIRDWKEIQISRLNQRLMKEAQFAQYVAENGGMLPHSNQMMMMMNRGYNAGSHNQLYGKPPMSAVHRQQPMYGHSQQQQYMQSHPMAHSQRISAYPNEMRQYHHQYNQHPSPNQPASQLGRSQYDPTTGVQYGPQGVGGPSQYDHNPYITVDDEENHYAQIGEPSRLQPTPRQVYQSQNSGNPPRRY